MLNRKKQKKKQSLKNIAKVAGGIGLGGVATTGLVLGGKKLLSKNKGLTPPSSPVTKPVSPNLAPSAKTKPPQQQKAPKPAPTKASQDVAPIKKTKKELDRSRTLRRRAILEGGKNINIDAIAAKAGAENFKQVRRVLKTLPKTYQGMIKGTNKKQNAAMVKQQTDYLRRMGVYKSPMRLSAFSRKNQLSKYLFKNS